LTDGDRPPAIVGTLTSKGNIEQKRAEMEVHSLTGTYAEKAGH
jgi:hypothetical protein